jgi:hypothetical protein
VGLAKVLAFLSQEKKSKLEERIIMKVPNLNFATQPYLVRGLNFNSSRPMKTGTVAVGFLMCLATTSAVVSFLTANLGIFFYG